MCIRRVRILCTSTALLLLSEYARPFSRQNPSGTCLLFICGLRVCCVWSAAAVCGLLCFLPLRVLCGLVRWSCVPWCLRRCFKCRNGFWVCGSGGGSSRARYYLQVRRAERRLPSRRKESCSSLNFFPSRPEGVLPTFPVPPSAQLLPCHPDFRTQFLPSRNSPLGPSHLPPVVSFPII